MRVALYGASGKVGALLVPALADAGHEVVDARSTGPEGCDAAIDFTRPDAVAANVTACLAAGVPVVIGTSGFDLDAVDAAARDAGVPCFYAPNFALGAVLMMRFAEEAAKRFPRAEIVELHAETKRDAPSGTAKATAARMGTDPQIHSVRLPGSSPTRRSSSAGRGRRSRSGTTRPRARRSSRECCSRSSGCATSRRA